MREVRLALPHGQRIIQDHPGSRVGDRYETPRTRRTSLCPNVLIQPMGVSKTALDRPSARYASVDSQRCTRSRSMGPPGHMRQHARARDRIRQAKDTGLGRPDYFAEHE